MWSLTARFGTFVYYIPLEKMLDRFVIFSKAGVILWSMTLHEASGVDPVSSLVQEVLLPDRLGLTSHSVGDNTVKWHLANSHDIIFAAVYTKSMAPMVTYVDTLLKNVAAVFISQYGEQMVTIGRQLTAGTGANSVQAAAVAGASALACQGGFDAFAEPFNKLWEAAESKNAPSKVTGKRSQQQDADSDGQTPNGQPAQTSEAVTPRAGAAAASNNSADNDEDDAALPNPNIPTPQTEKLTGLAALKAKGALSKKDLAKGSPAKTATSSSSAAAGGGGGSAVKGGTPSKGKEKTSWDDFKFDEKKASTFDKSRDKPTDGADAALAGVQRVAFSGTGASGAGADLSADDDGDDAAALLAAAGAGASGSGEAKGWFGKSAVGSWLSSLTGNKVLSRTDLEPVIDHLKQQLMAKNVAMEVADSLCASLVSQLEGTKLDAGAALTVQSKVAAAVTIALRDSIERILTPRRPVDVLREVKSKVAAQAARPAGHRDPYVIVVCGVNGVGKSTSLSKITFHLKDHGHSVLIAACDSFRAGAVEQLKRHCAALSVPLYQQGYAKDPVVIAGDAIKKAREDGVDVVLVDTAGRMQNNATLMQQLAKLVAVNKPDLVLFVGEALVGNDGVDQLSEFDRALVDLAVDATNPRRIDGIVLTKFDTVDDKVGAALSMVYRTSIPIVFLGTGQQYQDLKRLNVAAVVKSLLS